MTVHTRRIQLIPASPASCQYTDPAVHLPTGQPERDAIIRQQFPATRERHTREREHLVALAGQLGAATPRSRREILPCSSRPAC